MSRVQTGITRALLSKAFVSKEDAPVVRLNQIRAIHGMRKIAATRNQHLAKLRAASSTSTFTGWDPNGRASLGPLASSSDDVYVVSSCSRGIGLEFAKQLLERTQGHVVGLVRDPNGENTVKLAQAYPDRFSAIAMDLRSQESVEAAAHTVKERYNRVSLLLNVAGILGDGKTLPGPERSLSRIDRDWLLQTLDINLIGHVMVTQALQPLLKGDATAGTWSKVASLSARVGSIGDNRLGGWYSYRMSKAALNQFTKTASLELKRQRCLMLALHPGTTDTDLSVPFQQNVKPEKLFPVWYSVGSMLDVIWGATDKQIGGLYAYDGSEIPW
eukprot:gnl/TRDRNA2_/TRDRNA2_82817_c0_seq1.p1 gnl/TRDRNA2_/TRDRNA2_82817_c0~~gnl/TRDRNA2_/TRDRNA2_82817_c0_seq1.p1  ORF type:complete len:384 (+),score=33.58 gnl/TRDRNA2_/TRDRNA2_82817_c0_seq1:168-1154(+)